MNFDVLKETLPEWSLQEVTLRVAQPEEIAAACAALEREHYLGAPQPCNREIVQLTVRGEQVLAVVVWTHAARKLAGREAWLGWDPRTHTRRPPLVVQNTASSCWRRRASPISPAGCSDWPWRRCARSWEKRTGTRALLAKTFVDPERYAGTCYKAAGWIELGETAGCGHHGEDYYVAHGHPKRLWLRPFEPDARARLREPLEPIRGETHAPSAQLPVPAKTATSLAEALRKVAIRVGQPCLGGVLLLVSPAITHCSQCARTTLRTTGRTGAFDRAVIGGLSSSLKPGKHAIMDLDS